MSDDQRSSRRVQLGADMVKRIIAALSARALWAVIVDLMRGES
ncbi:hypothetical protein [Streptomyces sp. NPDC051211]